jgi:phage baseplate assembly protein W
LDFRFFDPAQAQGPLAPGEPSFVRPVRVGRERRTGKLIMGWSHVEQSIAWIFHTRFHTRPLRRWVGSFVPHLLGENMTARTIGRFYWAIATSLDLWEPDYRVKQVNVRSNRLGNTINSPEQLRMGNFEVWHVGEYRPRGHLGDPTPEVARQPLGLVPGSWESVSPKVPTPPPPPPPPAPKPVLPSNAMLDFMGSAPPNPTQPDTDPLPIWYWG